MNQYVGPLFKLSHVKKYTGVY